MMHLNQNLLCAIDTETTGLDPTQHEIIEVAIIPLSQDLLAHPKLMPFHLKLRPDAPENADPKAMSCNKAELAQLVLNGVNAVTAADMLEKWFKSLPLPDGKKIVPLGYNYAAFDLLFMKAWLGEANYAYMFDHNIRDVFSVVHYINDRSFFVNENVPFPKMRLQYVADQLLIKNPAPHTALGDAYTAALCYRTLMGKLPYAMGPVCPPKPSKS